MLLVRCSVDNENVVYFNNCELSQTHTHAHTAQKAWFYIPNEMWCNNCIWLGPHKLRCFASSSTIFFTTCLAYLGIRQTFPPNMFHWTVQNLSISKHLEHHKNCSPAMKAWAACEHGKCWNGICIVTESSKLYFKVHLENFHHSGPIRSWRFCYMIFPLLSWDNRLHSITIIDTFFHHNLAESSFIFSTAVSFSNLRGYKFFLICHVYKNMNLLTGMRDPRHIIKMIIWEGDKPGSVSSYRKDGCM